MKTMHEIGKTEAKRWARGKERSGESKPGRTLASHRASPVAAGVVVSSISVRDSMSVVHSSELGSSQASHQLRIPRKMARAASRWSDEEMR